MRKAEKVALECPLGWTLSWKRHGVVTTAGITWKALIYLLHWCHKKVFFGFSPAESWAEIYQINNIPSQPANRRQR
jgi:hypothetical protein